MNSAVEVRQLRAFVALVQHGSVTAAARALGLAQSTISEALSSLERSMGAPLFLRRRGSHEVVLTDAGTALLPHARSVLDEITAAHVAIAASTTGARARVAIATNESLSTYVLGPHLEIARRRWPNTSFEVTVMVCAGVRSSIELGEQDVGMILRPIEDQSSKTLVVRRIIAEDVPLVVFSQPRHPLARTTHAFVPRDALDEYPLYISDAAGDFHLLVRRYLQSEGLPTPLIHPTGSVESVKRSVLRDVRAIGVLPAYALADEMRNLSVVALHVQPAPPPMRLEALTPAARSQHPAIQQLIDGVAAAYAPATHASISP
ncbi:MAG: LysR family transcriptional regulator [Gemmatimonadota bacterium]